MISENEDAPSEYRERIERLYRANEFLGITSYDSIQFAIVRTVEVFQARIDMLERTVAELISNSARK